MNSSGQSSPLDFNRIVNGVIRAAQLDKTFFKQVEKDTSYTQDALVVVVVVSLISALGSFLGGLFAGHILQAIGSFIWTAVWGVAAFYLWCFLVSWIGTSFFKGQGDFGEVQRCLGFAYGPQVLGILAVIPCLGWLAGLIGWIWSMVVGFVAVREALDQDNTNAVLTIVISGVIVIILTAIIGGILAGVGLAGAAVSGAFK